MKVIGKINPLLLCCLVSLSVLSETIYSPALPEITKSLNTEGGIAQMSSPVYFVGFALGIFTLGRISDIFGRRPVILFGVLFYSIISLLISYSPNIKVFIALRLFQAYGASISSVVVQAMIRDSYAGWELSSMFASVPIIMSTTAFIGTLLGGYIVEYYNWQYIFRFLVVISSFYLILYLFWLPETNPYIGNHHKNGFFRVVKVVLKDKVLLCYAFIIGSVNGILLGFYIQAPFIFIGRYNMPSSDYSHLFFILIVANIAAGLVVKHLIRRFMNTFKIKVIGFSICLTAATLLYITSLRISDDDNVFIVVFMIFFPMMLHIIGHTFSTPMLLRHALEDYGKVKGTAGSVFGCLYYLITAAVNFFISWLHSDKIDNFAKLFLILMITSITLFYLSNKWKKNKVKYEFD